MDPANTDAARAWDGEYGEFWAGQAARFDDFIAGYRARFLAATRITGGERVLDIGCGNGQTTRDAARLAGSGSVLGVDLSSSMLETARRLAAERDIGNASFVRADAQVHSFERRSFDVAISRTGVMFFGDPVAAFANIATALRDGGRLVLLVWQEERHNPWVTEIVRALAGEGPVPRPPADAPCAFALADPRRTRTILTAAGFNAIAFDDVREHVYLGPDAARAYRFVLGLGHVRSVLARLDERDHPRALGALRESIAAHTTADGVRYPSAAWLVRARLS
ncbi:class I SAM-dependent methyltransferase [Qaidamihabitans albus]|uniref:class I SAM-dependent methyltransferase n=1 Tax=Qaidamihabitans albus TaxID=2795733 RepID=UPI0027DD1DFC|nr:methyltransferase domain-containing protein [Qaidamihabitans albus]